MKAPALGTRRQAILFGGLVLVLIFAVVKWSRRDPVAPTPVSAAPGAIEGDAPRPAIGRRPRPLAAEPQDVPLITRGDLDPLVGAAGGGSGRDLFDPREPTPLPTRVPTPLPTLPPMHGPLPPPPPTPTPTPPEPPFRLIGIFGPRDRPIALLQAGDETYNAREGDVILVRWIIRRVGYESIDVGFVGFSPAETRRLGITP